MVEGYMKENEKNVSWTETHFGERLHVYNITSTRVYQTQSLKQIAKIKVLFFFWVHEFQLFKKKKGKRKKRGKKKKNYSFFNDVRAVLWKHVYQRVLHRYHGITVWSSVAWTAAPLAQGPALIRLVAEIFHDSEMSTLPMAFRICIDSYSIDYWAISAPVLET